MKQKFLDFFTLFTSASTLVCCAIPALLVALGLGATLAGAISAVPQIVLFSEYKVVIFLVGSVLLVGGGVLQKINQNAPCPIDPVLRGSCLRTRKRSLMIYLFSLGLFLVGAFFAFLAPILF